MMKERILFIGVFVLLITAGCSQTIVKSSSINTSNGDSSGKYEYLLSEALRQKYIGSMSDAMVLLEECIKISPERAVAYFELAQILAVQGEIKKSIDFAVEAADREKENIWLQIYCGGALANNGSLDSSLIFIERALKMSPEDPDIKTMLGKVYLEQGDIEKAEKILRDLKEKGLLGENEMMNIVSALLAAEYNDEAESWVKNLIIINSEEVRYKAMLADIYRQKGLTGKADSIYSSIIRNNPEDGESQMLAMSYVIEKKDYKNALSFLSAILLNDQISRDRKVEFMRFILSDTLFVNQEKSILDLNLRVLEAQYRGDEEVLSLRPEMYVMVGMNNEAIERYKEIIDSTENAFFSGQQLIVLLAEGKRYDELYAIARPFATNYNKSILGKVYYALSAMELKKYDIAEDELKKAMILAGNNDELKFNVLSMQADLAYRKKEFVNSFSYLEEALKIKPEDNGTLNNYAYYLAENNTDLKKALTMAEKVVKSEPDNATFIDTYGWVLFKMGKYRKAYNSINSSISLSKERDPELLEHLGYVLQRMKKFNEAKIYFEEALRKDKSKEYLKIEIEKCSIK